MEKAAHESRYALKPAPTARGIDHDRISGLVEHFYGEVRGDALLGPIFEARVGEDWDAHLDKMRRFWRTVLLAEPGYRGNPMQVHRELPNLTPEAFAHWLELFEASAREVLEPEAASLVTGKATRMARALSTAALGAPCV